MNPAARSRGALALDVERERGRRSLAWFIRQAWPLVEKVSYSHNWHIEHIAEHLQAVTRGEIRKLIINVPPSSMKSLSVCVFWSAWQWIIDPSIAQLYTSFDAGLTLRDGRKVQEILGSEWFRDRWGHRVRVDANEPGGQFKSYNGSGTDAGGWRFATSIEGKTTGWHPNVKVIDDPTKPKDATPDNLAKVISWYYDTFCSRARDPNTVAEVIIMQRLADGDLAGHLLEKGEHEHVCIPLEYEPARAYATKWGRDPRTVEGESFWLGRFTPDVVAAIKARYTVDIGVYSCQYQQNPIPLSGQIFHAEWLNAKQWTILPDGGTWIQSWDMTFKGEAKSDFVVGGLWLGFPASAYLVDVYRERIDFAGAAQAVKDKSRDPLWGRAKAKLIEDKANGPAIMSHLQNDVPGMVPIKVDGDAGKVARARAITPYFKAGNVWLPEAAAWLAEYKLELLHFPRGKHDDQVDMTSQALDHIFDPSKKPIDLAAAMANARKLGLLG